MATDRQLSKEFIKRRINSAIINKEILPGDRIVETRLARQLNVSQSPVREALNDLEHMGVVETIPYRGCFVKGISHKDMINSYKLRKSFEVMVIEEVVGSVSKKALDPIRNPMQKMLDSAEKDDFESYISFDTIFHRDIMMLSDNDMLIRMWDRCDFQEWTRIGTAISGEDLITLAKRHEALYVALNEGNRQQAVLESRKHWNFLIDMVENEMSKSQKKNEQEKS